MDDPSDESGAAWGVREQLRRLLACPNLANTAPERGPVRPVRGLGRDARDRPAEEDRRRLVAGYRHVHPNPRHQCGPGGARGGRQRGRHGLAPQFVSVAMRESPRVARWRSPVAAM